LRSQIFPSAADSSPFFLMPLLALPEKSTLCWSQPDRLSFPSLFRSLIEDEGIHVLPPVPVPLIRVWSALFSEETSCQLAWIRDDPPFPYGTTSLFFPHAVNVLQGPLLLAGIKSFGFVAVSPPSPLSNTSPSQIKGKLFFFSPYPTVSFPEARAFPPPPATPNLFPSASLEGETKQTPLFSSFDLPGFRQQEHEPFL